MFTDRHILLLVCILLAMNLNAQDTSKTFPSVLVQAERDSIVKIAVITSTIPHFKLDANQLNELGVKDIGEAMKYLPGVQIRDYGGIGGVKTLAYRGIGAGHTAVELDGNQIASAQTGVVNLSGFETFGLQLVRFSSGVNKSQNATASSFVQANTIASVSVLSNPPPKGKAKFGIYSNTTSINAYEKGGYISTNLGNKLYTGVQGMLKFGNGTYPFTQPKLSTEQVMRENTALFNWKIRGLVGFKSDQLKIIASGFYENNMQELPGAAVLFNPANDQKLWNENLRLTSNLKYEKGKWNVRGHLNYQANFTRYLDPHVLNLQGYVDAKYLSQQSSTGFMLTRMLKRKTECVFVGADYVAANLYGNNLTLQPVRLQNNVVVGASKWVNRFNFEGNISSQFIADQFGSAEKQNKKRYAISPFLAVAVLPFKEKALRLRIFYKNTFRMPSFNDLYYNAIGNINLKPEQANMLNMGITYGVKQKKWNAEFTVDGYFNTVENKIVAIPTKDLFNWSMQNIGKTEILGLDIAARFTVMISNTKLNGYTNHNFNSSLDVTDPKSITYMHQIPYTPYYSSSSGVNLDFKHFYFSSNVLISGFRFSLNENIYANYLKGFTDLNLGVGKEIDFKKSELIVDVKAMNVLNKNYQVIRSFPMPGRYYQLRLIFKSNS